MAEKLYVLGTILVACSRLRDSGEKSFSKKKWKKRAGAGYDSSSSSSPIQTLISESTHVRDSRIPAPSFPQLPAARGNGRAVTKSKH